MGNLIGAIKKFNDLKVWKDAHLITIEIYNLTKKFPRSEEFGLTSQMRRSSSSVGANIVEGFGRFHYKEKIRFYLNSRGSLLELQNHLFLAKDLNYLNILNFNDLIHKTDEIAKEINGLINSINNKNS